MGPFVSIVDADKTKFLLQYNKNPQASDGCNDYKNIDKITFKLVKNIFFICIETEKNDFLTSKKRDC